MERIKKAIEKAREERDRVGAVSTEGRSQPSRSISRSVENVSYSQTREVNVSRQTLHDNRIVSGVEPGPYADSYKVLRTQVLQRLEENGWNSIGVTSSIEGEGKTLTAINLAISLAQEVNKTVLLVDANLRNPTVHEKFGLHRQPNNCSTPAGDADLQDLLLHPSGIDRFIFLPGGQSLPNSAEMLSSPKMVSLVDQIKARYESRIIVFDLPPMLASADTLAFSPYVESALLVIEEGKVPADEVEHAARLLESTRILGTVLNNAECLADKTKKKPGWFRRLSGRLE